MKFLIMMMILILNDDDININNMNINNNNLYLNINSDDNKINDENGIDLELEKKVNEIMKKKLGNLNI